MCALGKIFDWDFQCCIIRDQLPISHFIINDPYVNIYAQEGKKM